MGYISISALLIKYDTRDILRMIRDSLSVHHTDIIAVRLPSMFSPFVVEVGNMKLDKLLEREC